MIDKTWIADDKGKAKMDISLLTIGDAAKIAAMFGPTKTIDSAVQHTERAVLVTTEYRGVFFGYATDTSGDTIHLRAARNCIYWPSDNKGFLGLAADGPKSGARVGPPADIELRKITCVAAVSADAVKAWEASPWSK